MHTFMAKIQSGYFHVISPNVTKCTAQLDRKMVLIKERLNKGTDFEIIIPIIFRLTVSYV